MYLSRQCEVGQLELQTAIIWPFAFLVFLLTYLFHLICFIFVTELSFPSNGSEEFCSESL